MKKWLLAGLGALSLIGCSSNKISEHSVQVGSMGDISITDMRSARVNGLLVAQAKFHNSGSSSQTGFYRCQFSDANKMAVGDAEVWQPITIYNNEDQPIKCMATQLEATDFKVEFSADTKNVSVFQ